jgi:hypothetical protein
VGWRIDRQERAHEDQIAFIGLVGGTRRRVWRGWQQRGTGYLRIADVQTARGLQHIELGAGMRLRHRVYRADLFVVRPRLPDEQRSLHHGTHRLLAFDGVRWTRYVREQFVRLCDGLHGHRM